MAKGARLKLAFLSLFIVCLFVALFTDSEFIETAHGFSSGPPGGRTGAPGELTCLTSGCHSGSLNGGPGSLVIEAPSVYEPGETYEITVRHSTSDSSRRRWGFQLTALRGGNLRAGNLQNLDNRTAILNNDGPGFNRQYIEHTSQGTFQGQTQQASWRFNWTAPAEDVGPVILYAAGNQANSDGTSNGDQIYTAVDAVLTGPPDITEVNVAKKNLVITGDNFDLGAKVMVNGAVQKKASNNAGNLTGGITVKKGAKKISPGQTVIVQIENPDGTQSAEFEFRRPN